MDAIGEGFRSFFRRREKPVVPEKSPFASWAQPLADEGKIDKSHLYLMAEVERWTKKHKEAVLEAAAQIPRESTVVGRQVYRFSTQVEDGREVASALKLYQGVLDGQDRLSPKLRETLFLNMFRLHQKAEPAHRAYQAYLNGQGTAAERLLGDMSTASPGKEKWQNAEVVFELFKVASGLSEEDRKLFRSVCDAHGVYNNASYILQAWGHIARQPDKGAATAAFLDVRQEFAARHPSRGDHGCEYTDPECYTGFATRVLGEQNEALPVFTQLWRQENCDPFPAEEAVRVLRDRVGHGLSELTVKDAKAVMDGLAALKTLSGRLPQEHLTWLYGNTDTHEFAQVASALEKVMARSPDGAQTLMSKIRKLSDGASPEEKAQIRKRLHEICVNAILFDGDADLSLESNPLDRRGITVSENRVQIGQTSIKRRKA